MNRDERGKQLVESFSIAGKHHNYENKNNQDAILFKRNQNYCAMVLADGVSTCEQAKMGAKIACQATTDFLLQHAKRIFHMNHLEAAECLIAYTHDCLEKIAKQAEKEVSEYSSTLACVLFDRNKNQFFFCSIGDSLITATKDNNCYIIAMPSDSRNGCCVTTTPNPIFMAKAGVLDATNIESIMICSDGAWHFMYHRNRMQQQIKEILIRQDYETLKKTFLEKERFDDCSFITMNPAAFLRRNSV